MIQIDWKRIIISQEANDDLVRLFCEYDTIHIQGTYADISFDISRMQARNSVIETNYPGYEVFSAPALDGVNGWIEYHNPVYHHSSGHLLTGLRVEISHNLLQKCEIFGIEEKDSQDEQEAIAKIMKQFEERPGNKRVGEIAFGTNFFVPTGIKHILIEEKAFGMHFAFGRSFPYPEVDNGNHDAKSVVVMEKGIFTQQACPRIYAYYQEVIN